MVRQWSGNNQKKIMQPWCERPGRPKPLPERFWQGYPRMQGGTNRTPHKNARCSYPRYCPALTPTPCTPATTRHPRHALLPSLPPTHPLYPYHDLPPMLRAPTLPCHPPHVPLPRPASHATRFYPHLPPPPMYPCHDLDMRMYALGHRALPWGSPSLTEARARSRVPSRGPTTSCS